MVGFISLAGWWASLPLPCAPLCHALPSLAAFLPCLLFPFPLQSIHTANIYFLSILCSLAGFSLVPMCAGVGVSLLETLSARSSLAGLRALEIYSGNAAPFPGRAARL